MEESICVIICIIVALGIAYNIDKYNKEKKIKEIKAENEKIISNKELNTLSESTNLNKSNNDTQLELYIQNKARQDQELIDIESSKILNINNFKIPNDMLKLLWIGDGLLKNYNIQAEVRNYKDTDIAFIQTIEPSCIFTELPIEECDSYDLSNVDNLGYYPNYFSLDPEQKFYYLKWLEDITQHIPIGYVFIFYYGLERHLIEGNFEEAFQTILKLKNTFDNASFQAYSTDALLIACVLKNRKDYFKQLLGYIKQPDILCIIKIFLNEPLSSEELIDIRKSVGFTNNYYIKKDYNLFKDELNKLLVDRYGNSFYPTSNTIIDNTNSYLTLAMANISLEKRFAKIPDVYSNKMFAKEIKDMLVETHNKIKNSRK